LVAGGTWVQNHTKGKPTNDWTGGAVVEKKRRIVEHRNRAAGKRKNAELETRHVALAEAVVSLNLRVAKREVQTVLLSGRRTRGSRQSKASWEKNYVEVLTPA